MPGPHPICHVSPFLLFQYWVNPVRSTMENSPPLFNARMLGDLVAQDTPNLIQGSITRALLTLAIPIVFANLLQTAYQLTDTFWVGRLGADAVAAVSLSFPVLFFLISLGIGLAVAGTILVAQNKGRGDLDAVNHVAAQALMGVIALSLLLAAIGYFIAAPLVAFLGASASVQPHATSYLQVSFLGLPFMFCLL